MSNKTASTLWTVTGLIALLLLIATIGLTVRAQTQPVVGVEAQVNGRFYLRDAPYGGAGIITALRGGTAVTLIDSEQQGQTLWYQIEFNQQTGWMPSNALDIIYDD